ncbi:hypothetical protein C1637_09580 [Chryseobacterium lactis]|uniref:NACHT domain-containing protein n=1 Tax=Chryseobacterium lactis TaxID=1241981 RepID=A0A3G6RHF0_CHRLC|nr:hypothetical protein [Chryseobacterium lactis]AZA82238.1 hypothetical protein EG342_10125 [Chryseobacterium lactis]AZB02619.1 hypothetical protein EG341_00980 [Chryseobacterium lactis]PNW14087.1 hypothetical protein C1637_09580 [Chryseobacterium lactis]
MRNAFSGYTYQKHITLLLLSIMDAERNISRIEIEAKVDNKFDDLTVSINNDILYFQIKDFENINITDLIIKSGELLIKGKPHKLSTYKNILFFKHIDIIPNSKILDFDCYKLDDIYIVSMSRRDVDIYIDDLYNGNLNRRYEIEAFLNELLDERIWKIDRISLPILKTFNIDLQETSVNISHKLLEFEKILLIEGKPGVGKSHFVNSLTELYPQNILYRFWIGNQDRDYLDRLKFKNFIQDIFTKTFKDLKDRSISDLFQEFKKRQITFIIDGLDHVENYNKHELDKFIEFIKELKEHCKVIVLSRPLVTELEWKKHILENWNKNQTEQVLDELFHISDYKTQNQIFYLTQGYPLLVKYVAEFYKLNKELPEIEQLKDIDSFYEGIIKNEKGKHSLLLFLCTDSYIMFSELEIFLGESKYYVEEFIKEHPYLFDIKLNRVSLFHDSFNTYLRNRSNNYKKLKDSVNEKVYNSVTNLEKRFLSRLSLFKLEDNQRKQISRKFCSISTFEQIIQDNIDIEAIRDFYFNIRDSMYQCKFNDFEVLHYYELSLIINLLYRDHISTPNGFLYTYVKTLLFNGYTEEDITSSGYLFGMLFYLSTNNPILLYNNVSNDNYSTEHFHKQLNQDVNEEEYFFIQHDKAVTKKRINELLKNSFHFKDYLVLIIENLYIHQKRYKGLEELSDAIEIYLDGFESRGAIKLTPFLDKYPDSYYYANWYLKDVKENLIAKGYEVSNIDKNDYNHLTLKELILKYKEIGSFNLGNKIHEYIRLALNRKQHIDISSISVFWTKYYNRKDYTFYSIPMALKTLESKEIVSLEECIKVISEIQNISEKGYSYLLGEFIELYQPSEIIPKIEACNLDHLSLQWFLLPTKYINSFNNKLYNYAMNQLTSLHRSGSIEIGEIKNALLSNKLKDIELTFSIIKLKIRVEKSDEILKKINDTKLVFNIYIDNDKNKYKKTSEERFKEGVFYIEDIDFIKDKKLCPSEVAKLSDGSSSCLAEMQVFDIFEKKEVANHFKELLYNAIIGKTKRIDYNYILYYTPGNVLYMIDKYGNKKDFEAAVKSFKRFMKLSLVSLQ